MTELVAGRELDALVAIKVMGWMRVSDHGNHHWLNVGMIHLGGHSPSKYRRLSEWNPSTSIADAWEVLEAQFAYSLNRVDDGYRGFFAEIARPSSPIASDIVRFRAEGDSMPHAICLAALRAVEHSPETPAVSRVAGLAESQK